MAETALETVEARPVGRPSKYESHVQPFLNDILEWLKAGMNEYSICDKLDIGHNAWSIYKQEYEELRELYTRATRERNCLVMNSMFKKATGEKVQIRKAKVMNDGEVIPYTEETYVPPDVNAADLYLRNNDPDYKSAKNDVGNGQITINNFQLPQIQSELKQIEDELKKLEAIDITEFQRIE